MKLLLLLLLLQVGTQPAASVAQGEDEDKATEVVVLGMIHGGHRTSEQWGLDPLREAIRRIQPDVVLCEIPPDRWPGVLEVWNAKHVIEDDRVQRFPEYTDVLLPLMDELGFAVEPCAAWTSEMAAERREAIAAFEGTEETEPEDPDALKAYEQAEAWTAQWAEAQMVNDADPLVIHSRIYDHVTKGSLLAYDHWLNDRIGAGGWTNINQAHYALIEAALERHAGKRVLITFGAGHKYWFLEQLRWREDVRLLDPRPFLPGGDEPLGERVRVEEEAYAMAECVWRCWYDTGDVYMRPALTRIHASMDPHDAMPFVNGLRRSTQRSTFLDQEWLGPILARQDEAGAWSVSFEVRRALSPLDEEPPRVHASLVEDERRPGGYRWTAIQWPR